MGSVYLGRMVAVGITPSRKLAVLYRVSSRSFPNREAKLHGDKIAIAPRAGYESDSLSNPYISYHCAIIANRTAVLSNGAHTDPIAEKIAAGMPIRDAITLGLLALDYEKDAHGTPRIVAAARIGESRGWLGIIRKDGIEVRGLPLTAGKIFYLSTYERNFISEQNSAAFPELTAPAACQYILREGEFANFAHPVCAVAAIEADSGFTLANGE